MRVLLPDARDVEDEDAAIGQREREGLREARRCPTNKKSRTNRTGKGRRLTRSPATAASTRSPSRRYSRIALSTVPETPEKPWAATRTS
jgi:hypothetical protein